MLDFSLIGHVGLNHYITLSLVLFSIGVIGVLIRKNILVILMSIELMLNAVNISIVAFNQYYSGYDGQAIVFFVLTIAAAEAAVGLALVVYIYRRFKTLNVRAFEHLKG